MAGRKEIGRGRSFEAVPRSARARLGVSVRNIFHHLKRGRWAEFSVVVLECIWQQHLETQLPEFLISQVMQLNITKKVELFRDTFNWISATMKS